MAEKLIEIRWISNAPSSRQWWVVEFEAGQSEYQDKNSKLKQDQIATSRIIAQYSTLREAKAAHPEARLSDKIQKEE